MMWIQVLPGVSGMGLPPASSRLMTDVRSGRLQVPSRSTPPVSTIALPVPVTVGTGVVVLPAASAICPLFIVAHMTTTFTTRIWEPESVRCGWPFSERRYEPVAGSYWYRTCGPSLNRMVPAFGDPLRPRLPEAAGVTGGTKLNCDGGADSGLTDAAGTLRPRSFAGSANRLYGAWRPVESRK